VLRMRPLLVSGAAFLLVAGLAGPVFATEEPTEGEATTEAEGEADISHAAHECIELLEGGADIDECQEAPNPLLPETNEIIWGTFFFLVVAFVLVKFAVPALKKGMQARADKISADLQGAESAKVEAERVLADYQAQVANARAEADRIIEEARGQAEQVRADLMAKAEADAAEARARSTADLEASVNRLKADLQTDVGQFAIELAERIVERSIDRDAQQALIERYIAEVGGLGSRN
jgi:F-type H+-transporting ATPase subunit b